MRLARRPFLALCCASVAGCGGESDDAATTTTTTGGTTATRPPSGDPVPPQSLSVGNARSTPAFVTVAVERAGETVFVESRELVPGERHTTSDVLSTAGRYRVVVETAEGDRTTDRWEVVDGLDGLAVTLADGVTVRRTVRCDPDCAVRERGEALDVPLVGDGTARWYAPAQVVLTNPAGGTEATLTVSLDAETLVDATYRVPRETEVVVPLTYRSGTYRVAVETDAGRVAGDWRVPEEPARVVDVATLTAGCGAANTEFRVENADVVSHTLDVRIERDGTTRFAERYALAPGEGRAVVPVSNSGRYDVQLRVDDGPTVRETWWSCPPHGPATALVDATGAVTLQQAGL